MAAQKTSTGLERNVAGLLCYLVGWVTGLIFLLIEKEDRFVRFHAMQSIVVFGALTVVGLVLIPIFAIPIVGWLLTAAYWLLWVVVWIVLMVKAYQNQMYKLPVAGDFAERHI